MIDKLNRPHARQPSRPRRPCVGGAMIDKLNRPHARQPSRPRRPCVGGAMIDKLNRPHARQPSRPRRTGVARAGIAEGSAAGDRMGEGPGVRVDSPLARTRERGRG